MIFKLLKGYIVENRKKICILIFAVAIANMVIFANSTSKKSQAKYTIDTIYDQMPNYQATAFNVKMNALDKVAKNKNVKSYSFQKYFGLIKYSQDSYVLESYNDKYFETFKNKLIVGIKPTKPNEIIISKALYDEVGKDDSFNISKDLNEFKHFNISLRYVKEYKDSNNSQQIVDKNQSFKVVGVYDVTEVVKLYYHGSSIFVSENFDYPEQATTYDGIVSLKTGFNHYQNEVSKLSSSLGESIDTIGPNIEMERAIEENASYGSGYDSFDKAILIASVFMIFNVFNIMLKSMIKEIGMIRVIGMSKKKSLTFFLLKIAFIWLVGSILGLIGGYFLSSIMIKNFTYTVGLLDPRVAPVYLSFTIIKKTLITTTITVLLSTIIPIVVTIKSSPIELLNGTYKKIIDLIKDYLNKRKKKSIKKKKHFKFKNLINKTQENIFKNSLSATMAINNSKRNFIYILSTGIIVGMAGVSIVSLFSDQKSTLFKDNPLILRLNGYDIDLTYKGESSSKNNGISKECVDEISKIGGVTDIYTYKKEYGFLNLKDSELSERYRKSTYIKASENTRDNTVEVVSIPEKDMEQNITKNENILEDGRLFNKDSDVLEAVVYNKFYDINDTHTAQIFYNNLKVGDVVDLKVSVENNNKLEYKNIKIKVVGLLDDSWSSMNNANSGVPEIVVDPDAYYKFTGSSNFEQVKIKVDPNTSQQIKNEVKDKINYNKNIKYDDKNTLYNEFTKYRYQTVNQRFMEATLLSFAAFMNIIFSIITSIEVRSREFEVMRCVGLSIKGLKKILLKEGLIYGIVSSLIGFVFIFNYGVKLSYMLRMGAKYKNITYTGSWYVIPIIPTLIFILITIVACLLSVACTFKALDKPIIAEKNKNS